MENHQHLLELGSLGCADGQVIEEHIDTSLSRVRASRVVVGELWMQSEGV